jgi:hypothetical protein
MLGMGSGLSKLKLLTSLKLSNEGDTPLKEVNKLEQLKKALIHSSLN